MKNRGETTRTMTDFLLSSRILVENEAWYSLIEKTRSCNLGEYGSLMPNTFLFQLILAT